MKQRLFIAINLDNATKLALAKIITQLPALPAINKTLLNKLHLTLQFLGDPEEELIPEIQNILNSTVPTYLPIQLSFTKMGVFPHWQNPQVIWIGITGDRLLELQTDLAQQLVKLVPAIDTKRFTPHLTLARIKYSLPSDKITDLQSLQEKINLSATPSATSVDLMSSTLTPQGAIYTLISKHM